MKQSNYLPEELDVNEWLRKAEDDELTIKSILKHRDAPATPVCFFAQQMTEKYLKAFLVFTKKEFPKIHQLDLLLKLCAEIDQSFLEIKDEAIDLNDFYVAARYPGDYIEFSWQEAEEAYAAAVKIKEFILSKIQLR